MRAPNFTLALLASLGLCGCADMAVVDPGHRAVLSTPDGAISTLDEGESAVPSGSVVDDFDLRQLSSGGSFAAVTADGVPILVGDPVVAYSWIAEELVAADRELGSDGAKVVVMATVSAAISRVLATYRWDELDTVHIR